MRICVVGGMIDAKLHSKIAPLQHSTLIHEIHLVRRLPYQGDKIIAHSVPRWIRTFLPAAELWRLLQLTWICLRHRPRLLIAFGTMPHGLYIWLVGKLFRIKTIQHIMGKNDLRLTFNKQRGRKLAMRAVVAADLVAVRGRPMIKMLVQKGVEKTRIFVPQNIHDFSLFHCTNPSPPEYELIYVGLLSRYKRIDLLLQSFAASSPASSEAKLLIVGDGPEKQALQQLAEQLEISSRVDFVGKIPFEQLPAYYCNARTFIMTSQGEGLPMAMIEAMSCGLPVIIANDADITEIANHEHNALVVNHWTAHDFSHAIVRMRQDAKLYQHLRQNALQLRTSHQTEYSLDFQTRLWTEHIQSLFKPVT